MFCHRSVVLPLGRVIARVHLNEMANIHCDGSSAAQREALGAGAAVKSRLRQSSQFSRADAETDAKDDDRERDSDQGCSLADV